MNASVRTLLALATAFALHAAVHATPANAATAAQPDARSSTSALDPAQQRVPSCRVYCRN